MSRPPTTTDEPPSQFSVQTLLATESMTLRDVVCRGECKHRSAEECSRTTHLVFPYRGAYVRHLGRDDAVAEANQVLFFNAGESYCVSHPVVGGDVSLSLSINEDLLRELTPKVHVRDGGRLAFRQQRLRVDAHDTWPPEAFKPFLAMAASGGLRATLEAILADKHIFRAPDAIGPAFERPNDVSDETIETYVRSFVRTEQRTRDLERFLAAFDANHTVVLEPKLRTLNAPTLIVWGTDDIYFDGKWADGWRM